MGDPINTHNLLVDFGKHKGTPWTRVPVSYLSWLVNTPDTQGNNRNQLIAAAELARRGTVTPDLDISGHAIDRASLECRAIWHETALNQNEGLHAWLVRMSTEALKHPADEKGRRHFGGMWFAFEEGSHYPTLKTVHPGKSNRQKERVVSETAVSGPIILRGGAEFRSSHAPKPEFSKQERSADVEPWN